MAAPPGGPPDSLPPRILVVHPESGAVVRDLSGAAVIQFDEVIDEMVGGAAAGAGTVAGIGRQVILSPVAGDVDVSWHRKSIHVKPSEGWKPGRVYHLEVLPGIVDLSRNATKQGALVVFSTGPALPHAAISGTALQWVEQRALGRAVVRAARLPDTVAYVTLADSAGGVALTDVPSGPHRVLPIPDQNGHPPPGPPGALRSATGTRDASARRAV